MPIALTLPQPPSRRPAGLALTVLVHAALLLGWQLAQRPAPAMPEAEPATVQWLRLPLPVVVAPAAPLPAPAPAPAPAPPPQPAAGPARHVPATSLAAPSPSPRPAPAAPSAAPQAAPQADLAPPAAASGLLQRALRAAGGVDRTLRKENNPYIVAPLDSPQIRMRRGMEAAADLAPNKWYQAPKVEELVNNTGDGARRTRVITGGGSYCVTERATNTSIDMIEKHGKLRLTNCPEHETPASAQGWRTARD